MNYQQKQSTLTQEGLINEKQIIAQMSISKEKTFIISKDIRENWFLNKNTKELFRIIKDAILKDDDIHAPIVKVNLGSFYADCLDQNQMTANFENLVKRQKQVWLKYQLNYLIQKSAEQNIEDPLKFISNLWSELTKLSDGQEFERSDIEYLINLFNEEKQEYIDKKEEGRKYIGYETGIKSIDYNVDGLRDGHLIIIGGYTSAGKTQFVLNIVKSLIDQNAKTSIYSLEMSKVDILKRMLGIITGHNGSYILKNNKEDIEEIKNNALDILRQADLKVHTEKFDLNDILMSMVIEKQTQGVKAFIIDYAQLVKTGGSGLYEDMRTLAIKLQNFCRTQNVPVILVSQVSNESAKTDSNMIGFKGAGDLGASADLAIELRSGEEKEEREEKIANNQAVRVNLQAKKNRHGKIFNDELWFQPLSGQFFNECPSKEDF